MTAVWYIGLSNIRAIYADQWTAAGHPGRPTTQWDASNGWSLPKAGFTQAQIDLLDADDEFNINGADGPRPGDAAIPGLTDAASRSWVQEYLTGQAADPESPLGTALSATILDKVAYLEPTAGDQTARINAALAAYERVHLVGAFTTSTSLLIPSNTTLDASRAVITQTNNSNVNFVRNLNAGTATRDKNVGIVGGEWKKGTNGGTGNNNHAFFLRGIDGLTVRDIAISSVTGKYGIAIGDVTEFHVENIHFNVHSDGIHVTGPARSGYIGSVHGLTGDDMVAFTARDWPAYDDVAGDLTDIDVNGVYSNGSFCAVKMIAGTGTKVRRVTIRNVKGTTLLDGVRLFDDLTGASDLDGILLDGIDIQPGAGYSVIQITASLLKSIVMRNLHTDGTGYAASTLVTYGQSYLGAATAKSITIDGATISGNPTAALVAYINGNDTIDQLTIANINVPDNPGSMSAVKLQPGNAYVKRVNLRGVNVVRSNGNLIEGVVAGARIDYINVSSSFSTGGGAIVQMPTSTNPLVVVLDNCIHNGSNVMTATSPTTLVMNAISTTASVAVVRVQGANATPVRISGSGLSAPTGTQGFTRDASQAIYVKHPELMCEVNLATAENGSIAWNRNASLTIGQGIAVSNGTSWKNLYTGTVYP